MFRFRAFLKIVPALAACCLTAQAQNCTNETIRGYYAYSGQWTVYMQPPGTQPGQAPLTPVAVSSLATVTIDSQGRFSGPAVAAVGGQTIQGAVKGTVVVNSDCTATLRWTSSNAPGEAVMKWVILDNGNLIWEHGIVGLLGNQVGIATYKRISIIPPG